MKSPRRVVGAVAAAMALAQLWLSHRYFGFLTGDEVEVLGDAFRVAAGYDYRAWDIRNLFVPDFVVAPAIWLARALGVRDVGALIEAASLPSIVLSAVTVFLTYELARRWSDGDERAAVVAAVLFAFHWIPLAFGSTAYPRTVAAAAIVGAALLAERRPLIAGLLVGLAFADRFSEIVFIVPLLAMVVRASGEAFRRCALLLLGTAIAIGITVGWYDWMTYGEPFNSVINFAHLTLAAPDFASRVKYQSPLWYLANLARWCSPALLPLLWFTRDRRPWLFVVVPLVALSAIRHKELRYLQVLIPFLAIVAALGFAKMRNRPVALVLVVLAVATNLIGLRTFARKSMPAVLAARDLGRDPSAKTIVLSQLWAYGDRLYFASGAGVRDVGTPPVRLAFTLRGADTAALYETDLDPNVLATLQEQGFVATKTYRDGRARAVVVFRRVR